MHAVSEDGRIRIRAVVLDGTPQYYVEQRSVSGWLLVATALTIEQVAKAVDLTTLAVA